MLGRKKCIARPLTVSPGPIYRQPLYIHTHPECSVKAKHVHTHNAHIYKLYASSGRESDTTHMHTHTQNTEGVIYSGDSRNFKILKCCFCPCSLLKIIYTKAHCRNPCRHVFAVRMVQGDLRKATGLLLYQSVYLSMYLLGNGVENVLWMSAFKWSTNANVKFWNKYRWINKTR